MLQIGQINGGVRIEVRVQPRSSRNQVIGEQAGTLKVKLTAPPVDGEANATLLDFLSSYLQVPRRTISLVRGKTSRNKLVEIMGLSPEELLLKIGSGLSK
jgi:uncharacterized protein (TIGR00251 family)